MKHKYLSCELKIVLFHVERGFANSSVNSAMNWINGSNVGWEQQNENGHYKNESYLDQTFSWADNNNHLPGNN